MAYGRFGTAGTTMQPYAGTPYVPAPMSYQHPFTMHAAGGGHRTMPPADYFENLAGLYDWPAGVATLDWSQVRPGEFRYQDPRSGQWIDPYAAFPQLRPSYDFGAAGRPAPTAAPATLANLTPRPARTFSPQLDYGALPSAQTPPLSRRWRQVHPEQGLINFRNPGLYERLTGRTAQLGRQPQTVRRGLIRRALKRRSTTGTSRSK